MVVPVLKLSLDLNPKEIELLSRKDLRAFLLYAYRNNLFQRVNQIKRLGRKQIYHAASVAFIIGKQRAAEEVEYDYWGLEENDIPVLHAARARYINDFNKLIDDLARQSFTVDNRRKKLKYYLNRAELMIQGAVWTCYNQGKLALWDDLYYRQTITGVYEQKYKYKNKYMFLTAQDVSVCEICGPFSGRIADDPRYFPQPQIHANCRCEIIAIPTVVVKNKADKFRKAFVQSLYDEYVSGLTSTGL